MIKSLLRN